MLTISGPELVGRYYGESERQLRQLWARAVASAPSVIIIDEIDAMCPSRDSDTATEADRRLVSTLLVLMDGFASSAASSAPSEDEAFEHRVDDASAACVVADGVVVIATTNRPNALDPALRRAGRFDRELEVPIPGEKERLDIFRVLLARMRHTITDKQVALLASTTHGYVGADLAALCNEAALCVVRRSGKEGVDAVSFEDMKAAALIVRPSAMREVAVEVRGG